MAKIISDELKPVRCGCGGEAILKHYCYSYGDDDQYYFVWCERCDIQTKTYPTEAEAITAWNRAMGGVVSYPCTNPNGVYTSGCTITNTSSPNEDFHPVRDCMVGTERTAKVEMLLCGNCHESNIFDVVTRQHNKYCPSCGARLEWE